MVHAELGIAQENSGKLVTTVRLASRELAEARGLDVILTDGPPGVGCPVIASLTNADLVIIVTEPTPSAIHDMDRALDLCAHFRIPALTILNKVDINPALAAEAREFCSKRRAPVIASLGYDQAFTQAQLAGKSVVEAFPEKYGELFQDVWKRIDDLFPTTAS